MTLEDRIKATLGDLIFHNLILQQQIEEMGAKLAEPKEVTTQNTPEGPRTARKNKGK